jgi:hypothetical protein
MKRRNSQPPIYDERKISAEIVSGAAPATTNGATVAATEQYSSGKEKRDGTVLQI